jgi:hypothetical protein
MPQLMPIAHSVLFALAFGLVATGMMYIIDAIRKNQKEQISGKHSKYHHGTPRRRR